MWYFYAGIFFNISFMILLFVWTDLIKKSWCHGCFTQFSQQAPRGCRKWWPSYPTEETHTCLKPSQTGLELLGWSNITLLRCWRLRPLYLESSPHTCLITCWAWPSRAPKPRSYIYKFRQLFRPQSKFYVKIEQINCPGQYTGCD